MNVSLFLYNCKISKALTVILISNLILVKSDNFIFPVIAEIQL